MAKMIQRFFRHMRRRGETGQSIILLAIGFIALAGFVGITVDVSVMFVRFAQLSRAVDSAAIAAANQMRQDTTLATVGLAARQFIEFHGLNPESVWVDTCLTQPGDEELCTDEQSKLVRVRAFVKVPTVFMKLLGIPSFDLVAAAVSQTAALDVVLIMDVSESMASDTTVADWAKVYKIGGDPDPDTWARTNYGVIYQPPKAFDILEKVIDAARPAWSDAQVSAAADFNMQTWWEAGTATSGGRAVIIDPANGSTITTIDGLLKSPQILVNNRLRYVDTGGTAAANSTYDTTATLPRDPAYEVVFNDRYFTDTNFAGQGYTNAAATHPREECRVRFYPSANTVNPSRYQAYRDGTTGNLINMGQVFLDNPSSIPNTGFPAWSGGNFDGFVPTYNYFKCCNDPDNNGLFDDVTCQPFKQARDATLEFLQRIDFVRGDRAAFVTFDRTAFLINPYGYPDAAAEAAGDETDRQGAMLDNWLTAFYTLRDLIGVRAEPTYYVYKPGIQAPGVLPATWSGMAAGIDEDGASIPIDFSSSTYNPANGANPLAFNYPVFDNCPFANASLRVDRTLFDDALKNIALPNELGVPPSSLLPVKYGMGTFTTDGRNNAWGTFADPNGGAARLIQDPAQRGQGAGNRSSYNIVMAYEYWASCRSGNVGAALREGNNALLNPRTVRRFGTVWVMVMLSDGAAGATDPVRRNGYKIPSARPYEELIVGANPKVYGRPGDYGAFGVCPYGSPTAERGELVAIANDTTSGVAARFPYCSDEDPRTRNTCDFRPLRTLANYPNSQTEKQTALRDQGYRLPTDGQPNPPPSGESAEFYDTWNRARGNMYDVDIADGRCNPLYDVDDYAHDWADFIGLQDLAGSGTAQLPTIFTIGFGLGYSPSTLSGLVTDPSKPVSDPVNYTSAQNNADVLCGRNPSNCQGEQLLRYIADVGDNNKLDNDYWQDAMQEWYDYTSTGSNNPGVTLSVQGNMASTVPAGTFERRDPCQTPNSDDGPVNGSYDFNGNGTMEPSEIAIQWAALGPNRSCGNYYYAPDGNELQFVFDDIASRMFTRLSR